MKAIRWSDDDHYLGPFTYCKDKFHNLAVVLGSGDDGDYPGCRLRVSAFGYTVITALPPLIKAYRQKVVRKRWDEDLTPQSVQEWSYWDIHEREYGFSYGAMGTLGEGGFLQIFFGRQTHSSSTEQNWCCDTPWNNWRHVRHSIYDLEGKHFATEPKRTNHLGSVEGGRQYEEWRDVVSQCPTRTFTFADFDGELLNVTTRIEERQWEYGTGWFKWLSWFHKPKIHRSLDLEFSGETGKRKGSWKGGTVGHSIEMLPEELHQSAFQRYCAAHEMTYKGAENG